eukprot:TRINITY_DN543_c0_g1::TRINITY_DN543_c0_g1_i1::g.10538::m.10538 TRINITY_DN543_c0_g1::TRINITY_DN543_c0_g1_i1::g.10538  ORF type:complete len:105 (-),score=-8.44,Glyco_transf_25/PF01755.12/0.12 TRINITY_DN543_c0_g1_i1:292-606(-)
MRMISTTIPLQTIHTHRTGAAGQPAHAHRKTLSHKHKDSERGLHLYPGRDRSQRPRHSPHAGRHMTPGGRTACTMSHTDGWRGGEMSNRVIKIVISFLTVEIIS